MVGFRTAGWLILAGASHLASTAALAQQTTSSVEPTPVVADPQREDTTSGGIEEIIVTAERRNASVQRTPLAISAVGGESLQRQQIVGVEALATRLPNINFSRNGGDAKIFIRGIGVDALAPGTDPRVALYTDGVYNARTNAVLGSFYDIDRVEVLRGPQGTLYGRNATAGAINILSRDPTSDLEGYGTITVGNYDLIRTEGAVSGPLSDTISARLAFQTNDRQGYGKNIQTGQDVDDEQSRAVRAKVKIAPSSGTTILLEADYRNQDDHNGGYHFLANYPGRTAFSLTQGFVFPSNRRDYAGQGPNSKIETYGGSVTATIDLGGPVLTSITAYRHLNSRFDLSSDETTSGYLPTYYSERSKQFSQELRLAYEFGAVNLILGGYYFHEKNFALTQANISGAYFGLSAPLRQGAYYGGDQITNAYAAFGQATITFTPEFGVDLGLRYSDEKRRTSGFSQFDLGRIYDPADTVLVPGAFVPITGKASWSSLDPKITLHYAITPSTLAYLTYSKGFKSGGFNIGTPQAAFDPERINDFEGGIKADLFDRRLRTNLAAFYYKYSNLQVNLVEGIQLVTRNAAKAELYGIEAEITALPVDDLRLSLNAAWLHTEFKQYDTIDPQRGALGILSLAGNPLTYAPKYKFDGEIGYTIHTRMGIDLTPRANVAWVDRIYFTNFFQKALSQPPRTEVNLYLDADFGNSWSGGAYVKNLTDKYYAVSATPSATFIGSQIVGQVGPPRTYGLSLTKRF